MLAQLKKDLSTKETMIKKQKAVELKIKPTMDNESISNLITNKLIIKIKEKIC